MFLGRRAALRSQERALALPDDVVDTRSYLLRSWHSSDAPDPQVLRLYVGVDGVIYERPGFSASLGWSFHQAGTCEDMVAGQEEAVPLDYPG